MARMEQLREAPLGPGDNGRYTVHIYKFQTPGDGCVSMGRRIGVEVGDFVLFFC